MKRIITWLIPLALLSAIAGLTYAEDIGDKTTGWSTTAANNNATAPDGWKENMARSDVNDAARENMRAIRKWYNDSQWVEYGDGDGAYTPTYVAATQFSIDGVNVSSVYHVGRRVKLVATTPGTIYGTISAVSFSTNTTVTVAWDTGTQLSNEAITSVELGAMTVPNSSIPELVSVTSSGSIYTDTIAENTAATGVTIDSLVVKDGGITAAGTSTFASQTVSDLGTVTTANIDGGTLDGVTIGGSTAAAATVTTFTSTGIDDNADATAITIDSNETVQVDGIMAIGASTTDANMTLGLLIDQAGNDDAAVGLKSSDVAHGMTTLAETDTYGTLAKLNATLGGMEIVGYGEGTQAFQLLGRVTTADEAKNGTANAPFQMRAEIKSGTSAVVMGANDNIMLVTGGVNGVVFIIDAEGDFFYDGADGGAFDHHDDAAVARAFDLVTDPEGVIRTEFDDFIRQGETELIEMGILGDTLASGGLINGAQLLRLHNGAIWQQRLQMQVLLEVLQERAPGIVREVNASLAARRLPQFIH